MQIQKRAPLPLDSDLNSCREAVRSGVSRIHNYDSFVSYDIKIDEKAEKQSPHFVRPRAASLAARCTFQDAWISEYKDYM